MSKIKIVEGSVAVRDGQRWLYATPEGVDKFAGSAATGRQPNSVANSQTIFRPVRTAEMKLLVTQADVCGVKFALALRKLVIEVCRLTNL
jgi:hypothetical protein